MPRDVRRSAGPRQSPSNAASTRSLLDYRRGARRRPHGQDGGRLRRRGPRERGRPHHGRRVRHPGAHQLHGAHGRGSICLPSRPSAAPSFDLEPMVARTRRASDRVHGLHRGREGVTTGISAADRAHTIQVAVDASCGARGHRAAGPHLPAMARARRRPRAHRADRGRRRSGAPRGAEAGGGHLRDHERRRHHGARARPDASAASTASR